MKINQAKKRLAPVIAVVVPIFKHSVLAAEAIESALTQGSDLKCSIVLVNDGCPQQETDLLCREYALAYPDVVTYIRKPNGGLSDARNRGIQYALGRWKSVEAVYLLDADNRIRPNALRRSLQILLEDERTSWVYPNIDMFGLPQAWDYGGDYSLLLHTALNICEAGSLIHRRVFEAGHFFDTTFKSGYEDWEFFLSIARAGFKGANNETMGFQYRKRPESMLADAGREDGLIRGAIREKHKALLSAKSLVALEHTEAPRYAVYLSDRAEVLLCVDPGASARRCVALVELDRHFWLAKTSASRYHFPDFVFVTTSYVLNALERFGLIKWTFWQLENAARKSQIACLNVESAAENRISFTESLNDAAEHLKAAAFVISKRLFAEVVSDPQTEWINSLAAQQCEPKVTALRLQLPTPPGNESPHPSSSNAAFDLLSLIHAVRGSPYREAGFRKWDWRQAGISWRESTGGIVAREFGGAAAYPQEAVSKPQIGFLLPLFEFGGVEKVALNVASAMRSLGWSTHLFVLHERSILVSDEIAEAFNSINFLGDQNFVSWGRASLSYWGTDVPDWSLGGAHGRALGLLYWLDAVINFHGGAISGLMGQLRSHGVQTVLSLHLSDLTSMGRPIGNTYLGLAYEHAYDLVAPCSHQLSDWCHAAGIPADKIVPIPNAPGFDVDSDLLERGNQQRSLRDSNAPLRVLFLGRLDRQKGLDALAEVVGVAKTQGLPIVWRVVGRTVLDDDEIGLPATLREVVEPPKFSAKELSDLFSWADVFVLLSKYEGLPLTILEAMRAGVVPIATNVGALGEVIKQGYSGFLLEQEAAVSQCISALRCLALDRDELRRMSDACFESMRGRDWLVGTRPLSDRLLSVWKARAAQRGGTEVLSCCSRKEVGHQSVH